MAQGEAAELCPPVSGRERDRNWGKTRPDSELTGGTKEGEPLCQEIWEKGEEILLRVWWGLVESWGGHDRDGGEVGAVLGRRGLPQRGRGGATKPIPATVSLPCVWNGALGAGALSAGVYYLNVNV